MFKISNNIAEYETLLFSMKFCNILGAEHLKSFSNSQLVVTKVKREYEARDTVMVTYLAKVMEKSSISKRFEVEHVH